MCIATLDKAVLCGQAEEMAKRWKGPAGPPCSGKCLGAAAVYFYTTLSPLVVFSAFQQSHSLAVSSYPQSFSLGSVAHGQSQSEKTSDGIPTITKSWF